MSSRKGFLVASGAAAATTFAPMTVGAAQSVPLASTSYFNAALFARTLARPAKHRQCFAATRLNGGEVLHLMLNSLNAYEYELGEGPRSLHCAAVLYHGFVTSLAFDDAIWNELLLPARITDDGHPIGARVGDGNPYLHRRGSAQSDASVEGLSARGASFFVCNNSILSAATQISAALGIADADVLERLRAGIVPGAQVVPAGVMAVNALQEAHFTYARGSQ